MARQARFVRLLLAAAVAAGSITACDSDVDTRESSTITVWDYYGSSTPIKPVLAAFAKAHPEITVRYSEHEYKEIQEQFPAAAAKGTGPDVSTLDMTWLAGLAADGLLADLGEISHGRINDRRIEHVYASAALEAMTYDKKFVAAPFDYETYALYYRIDMLAGLGYAVPKTWAQFRAIAGALSVDAAERGRPGGARTQIDPDTFHFAQLLFQHGGEFLDATGTKSAFAGPKGVAALEDYAGLLADGGVYWGPENEKDPQGATAMKQGRIAMFIDGPLMMGVLKREAPEQAGMWGVAPVPTDGRPGSYLGGTGLGIRATSPNKDAAWKFVEYLLRKDSQLGVLSHASAVPTTNEAVLSVELSDPDPYFRDQAPFMVFLEAVATAKHLPHIKQWSQVATLLDATLVQVLTGKRAPRPALADAAKKVDALLRGS